MKYEAIFIDRDGTIGGNGHFVHPRNFSPFSYSLEAINLLKNTGVKLFALTNQHRISRGEATVGDFEREFADLGFDQSYICPHREADNCECRKPSPGMLIWAAQEHGLDLSKCVVVGDVGDTDMLAAAAVGATKVLVRTGWGEGSLGEYRKAWAQTEPDYIANDLLDAAHWIKNNLDPA